MGPDKIFFGKSVTLCQLVCRKIIFAVLDVSYLQFFVPLRSIQVVINLKFFYINICGFSSARRSLLPCSFYLHYTEKLSTIAVPHRDDTDIIMPLNNNGNTI